MSRIRFLLDENVDLALRLALLEREPQLVVWRVGDPGAPALGTLDPDILLWLEANRFILVTNNRKTMPVHLADHLRAGRHVPGIFILSAGLSLGATVEDLSLVWFASELEEYEDQVRFMPLAA
jgi:hypothetical protein